MVIRTVFRGPTNHVGARIIATAPGFARAPRIVRPYCHASSGEENHAAAAMELAGELGIAGDWASSENGTNGFVFVRVFPSENIHRSDGRTRRLRSVLSALAALDPIRFGGGAQ